MASTGSYERACSFAYLFIFLLLNLDGASQSVEEQPFKDRSSLIGKKVESPHGYSPLNIAPTSRKPLPDGSSHKLGHRLPIKHLGMDEGLIDSKATTLLTDRKGYLWIGTDGGGVFRFDGGQLEQFRRKDGLVGNRVLDLYEDRSGNIWIGAIQGVSRYDGRSFTSFTKPGHCKKLGVEDCKGVLMERAIYDIEQDSAGDLWFASAGGGVMRYDGEAFTYFVPRKGMDETIPIKGERIKILPGKVARTVIEGPEGKIWMGTFEEGMLAYDGKTFHYYGNAEGCREHGPHYDTSTVLPVGSNVFWNSMVDSRERLWISTPQGALLKKEKGWTHFRSHCKKEHSTICNETDFLSHLVNEVEERPDKGYWMATYKGAARFEDEKVRSMITPSKGLSGQKVAAVEMDREGTTWFATDHGVDQLLSDAVRIFDKRSGLSMNAVECMIPDENGGIWLGYSNGDGALDHWNPRKGDELRRVLGEKELRMGGVSDLHKGQDASIWIATKGKGLFRIKDGELSRFHADSLFPKHILLEVLETREGVIWTAGEGGVTRLSNDSIVSYGVSDGLHHPNISELEEGPKGRIWMGAPLQGISIYDNGTFTTLNADNSGMASGQIREMVMGPEGRLWTATFGKGVQILKNPGEVEVPEDAEWNTVDRSDGLPSDRVTGLHFDEQGRLWVATELGAARIDPSSKEVLLSLGRDDGFLGLQCTGAILSDEEGRVYFGTGQHLIRFDPEKRRERNPAPPLYIERVSIGFERTPWHEAEDSLKEDLGIVYRMDEEGQLPKELSLPYDRDRLTFEFKALDLRSPKDLRYRYRLKGAEKEWSYWQKQDRAVYNDLPPGEYTFMVRARDQDGQLSKKTPSFSFRIRPPWWGTDWFQASSAIGFVLLILLIFRWRTASIRKRKEELESKVEERTEELEEQRSQLASKNQEITDSIDYASSIQNALLPEESILRAALGEHFVFFRPKDMVSGDLYWCYAPSEDIAIWMVADCTGHGVPGALMGMMGNSLLDEVIVKEREWDPGRILGRIREGIVEKVGEDRKRDGMAAAICKWDKKNGTLSFAGGQNHLFFVRENLTIDGLEHEVQANGEPLQEEGSRLRPFQENINGMEIHGDKQAIGLNGSDREPQHFHTILIKLQKGDRIYLYSDGYPDQFGGPKDKKYGYRQFKSMIAANAFLPMDQQKEHLREVLDEWQGDREQVDDICVLGVLVQDPTPASAQNGG